MGLSPEPWDHLSVLSVLYLYSSPWPHLIPAKLWKGYKGSQCGTVPPLYVTPFHVPLHPWTTTPLSTFTLTGASFNLQLQHPTTWQEHPCLQSMDQPCKAIEKPSPKLILSQPGTGDLHENLSWGLIANMQRSPNWPMSLQEGWESDLPFLEETNCTSPSV